ncbi:MAG: sulfur carrier protein ThiS [Deltaproteobacteria bacterium]|nr:sulfur carrier protein ThiS [Deltaproteobacteria bacterium]
MISVQINGEEKQIESQQTVQKLLEFLRIKNQAVAVAINNEIVPNSEVITREIHEGDRIEVVRPVGGG